MPSAGAASASRSAVAATSETSGRLVTAETIAPQNRDSPSGRDSRETSGMRPRSTRSSSFESSAGRIVSEPTIATEIMIIVPIPIDVNTGLPASSIPAIAISTVRPETSTACPEVAAVTRSASRGGRPRRRSSRSRRR